MKGGNSAQSEKFDRARVRCIGGISTPGQERDCTSLPCFETKMTLSGEAECWRL